MWVCECVCDFCVASGDIGRHLINEYCYFCSNETAIINTFEKKKTVPKALGRRASHKSILKTKVADVWRPIRGSTRGESHFMRSVRRRRAGLTQMPFLGNTFVSSQRPLPKNSLISVFSVFGHREVCDFRVVSSWQPSAHTIEMRKWEKQ